MVDPIPEKLTRWSLERVRFVLSHLEGFVEDDTKEMRERARNFIQSTDLENVDSLVGVDFEPSDSRLPSQLLAGLSHFYESGLLLQQGPSQEASRWWVTDVFCRGNTFHLDLQDQILAAQIVPDMTPLQVHRRSAQPLLEKLNLKFLLPSTHAEAFLLRPTPSIAYLLITNLAPPWSADHLIQTQRLVNKCFLY